MALRFCPGILFFYTLLLHSLIHIHNINHLYIGMSTTQFRFKQHIPIGLQMLMLEPQIGARSAELISIPIGHFPSPVLVPFPFMGPEVSGSQQASQGGVIPSTFFAVKCVAAGLGAQGGNSDRPKCYWERLQSLCQPLGWGWGISREQPVYNHSLQNCLRS